MLYKHKKIFEEDIRQEPDLKREELKEILKPERILINGQRISITVMDKSVLMIFADQPILDTSLPHVNIFTSNAILFIAKAIC